MNLSIYDQSKGCFILNPKEFPQTINAFHKDFVKTYMPEFLSSIKYDDQRNASSKTLTKHTDTKRKEKPTHGTVFGMGVIPAHILRPANKGVRVAEKKMTMAEISNDLADIKKKKSTKERVSLAPKDFKYFSAAGANNVSVKAKKKK